MRMTNKALSSAILTGSALLFTAGIASAQSVALTASRQTTLMPDGNTVRMWGWTCGAVTQGTIPGATKGTSCTATNGTPQAATWQPPLITVPYTSNSTTGASTTALTITLTNNLPVIPTSLTIVGQLPSLTGADPNGPGNPTRESGRPQHTDQTATTWTTVVPGSTFTAPTQGARARSFVHEAAAGGGTVTYTWTTLAPGTYLIESGTYPSIQAPMGLYGVLVVTAAPTAGGPGRAYPAPGATTIGTGVAYDADGVVLMSEVDAVQNAAADAAINTTGFSPFTKWSPACSPSGPSGTANTCFPPAVDFTPTYYLINGKSFDKTNPLANAVLPGATTTCTTAVPPVCTTTSTTPRFVDGNILLRFVNAGLRMHVPSVVGLGMAEIAEDGHLAPDLALALSKAVKAPGTCASGNSPITFDTGTGVVACPKVQNDWFMAAGKVYDIIVKPTVTGSPTTYPTATFPAFDRELSLSTNNERDGGMQALIVLSGGTESVSAATGVATFASVNGGAVPAFAATAGAVADNYIIPHGATTFSGNVLFNDIGVHNASSPCVVGGSTVPQTIATAAGTVTLNPNGSFTLTGIPATFTPATFSYCGNGNSSVAANVTFTAAKVGGTPTAAADAFTSAVATLLNVSQPGVLANDTDPTGYPLTASPVGGTVGNPFAAGLCMVTLQANGSFTAVKSGGAGTCSFSYNAVNSQGVASATPAAVTLTFPTPSNLNVAVVDAQSLQYIGSTSAPGDYKWVIEQDLTFKIDPACQTNGPSATKPSYCPTGIPPTLGTNFHTSYMPVIASGCTGPQSCERGQSVYNPATGTHVPATCLHGVCTPNLTTQPASLPGDVHLAAFEPDGVTPARYYISILPGDSANPANVGAAGYTGAYTQPGCENGGLGNSAKTATGQNVPVCGHTMGGADIPAPSCTGTGAAANCTFLTGLGSATSPIVIKVQPNPLQTATLTIFVFEDDAPLNGEHDAGGNYREPGLGGFQVELWDDAGSQGDATGQMTYDIFNMPLNNSLNGTIDPLTGHNACPIAPTDADSNGITNQVAAGMIVVCPEWEDDGVTPSPLSGQAVVRNLMPGRFGVIVHPSAARESAGEVWYQTNTLDGTHFLDSFVKVGEPAYFQEYGPGGWHVFMGMANPAVINARKAGFCNGPPAIACNNTVKGQVSQLHQSRAPSETLYDSGVFPQGDARNYQSFAFTTCWAALSDPDGDSFMFVNCDAKGNFVFNGVPDGSWSLVVGDQWLDLIIDGSSKPINVKGGQTLNMDAPTFTWQTHIWNNTFMDLNGNGIQDDPIAEPGLLQVPARVRLRNGKFNNTLFTDISGHAHFNETFPLFNWYVVETDNTRFKNTGVHTVYDAGGQMDGPTGNSGTTACLAALSGGPSTGGGSSVCGNGRTGAYQGLLNSTESIPLPTNLRYPGSYYCISADCSEKAGSTGFPTGTGAGTTACTAPNTPAGCGGSTGRVDPGSVVTEGVQGFIGGTAILDWGKLPYLAGENGGIRGHVAYSSTRPFDDPSILFQNLWEPLVPGVTINLYQETPAPDGTTLLHLIDHTTTSSWDSFTQGFRTAGIPNINCPGQSTADPFFPYTLAGTPNFLAPNSPLPGNSQYKCYDGLHNSNQVQPAPYDGLYQFPTANCAVVAAGSGAGCIANPNAGQIASPATILPQGKYVVEVVVPPGYELVKEEDKNILLGDAWVGSATISNQFVGLGNIFIVPDQASINQNNTNGVYNPAINSSANDPSYTGPITGGANPYNANGTPVGNSSQPTAAMGRTNSAGFGPGGLLTLNTPCVGEVRIVPDYMSISPESGQVAPFAGSSRPLCDRKEVTLEDQMQAQAEFFVWTKTPAATHYTGFILDDFSSEFDQSSPGFGEKFAVPNLPVSLKDFNGFEISRTYSDQWGLYNGMVFSSWQVNPPNPTGYSPNMVITEMNSPGPIFAPPCIIAPNPNAIPPVIGVPAGCITNQTSPPTVTITDPYFNPGYSTFDYENPFMPGDTTYLDTPVVPVMAFAEAYNPPDCAYPDATPAIKSVVATADPLTANGPSGATAGGSGPWVSAAGRSVTITAIGDQLVPNNAYSGPAVATSPFNQKFITRHYGFGATQGTGSVTIGGVTAPVSSWGDGSITVTVPTLTTTQSSCPTQQRGTPTGTTPSFCGELVVTTGSGQHTVDAITVTYGGKKPTYINQENATNNAIQLAIDAASPGDEIVVGPGTFTEMLLMWKPLRLQGIGAASTVVNANTQPGNLRLDPWRREVNCLFGLGLNGEPIGVVINGVPNPFDTSGTYSCTFGTFSGGAIVQAAVDPIPLEPIIGWDANLNGNLSELLQEPTLLGAYEGAAITVLGKGLENNTFSEASTTCGPEGNTGCIPLNSGTDCALTSPFYSGNYLCNPSRIDGFTFTNSSQGGGGVFVHGWNHNLEISNNHVTGNSGTLTGGIVVGQAEVPDPNLGGITCPALGSKAVGATDAQPLCVDANVNMHNNNVSLNSSYGDELNSNTPAAGGGVTITPGSDGYKFSHNWVCGNLSSGDGGGMTHFGLSFNGTISHNAFLFNQSFNPTLTTNGGGLIVQGSAPDGTLAENGLIDVDAGPALSDGIGSGTVIDANLIMGNTAESGEGGGLRIQGVNGNDILNNPSGTSHWYGLSVTNNIIVNNVAGWVGGGVSIQDSVNVDFRNNTVVSNDVTASAGTLFDTLGAPNANTPPPNCNPVTNVGCTTPVTQSAIAPAGLVTHAHSFLLSPAFTNSTVACPTGAGYGTKVVAGVTHSECTLVSKPILTSDIIYQNRTFFITPVGNPAVIQLAPAVSQSATGSCAYKSGTPTYWDIGVYGDTSTYGAQSGFALAPSYTIMTTLSGVGSTTYAGPGFHNITGPAVGTGNLVVSEYCNGSRVPPEISTTLCTSNANAPGCTYPGAVGITVPPGVPDNNPFYANFTLTPAATVDEGNNFINLFYGPLTTVNPTIAKGTAGYGTPLGNYAPTTGSPAVNAVPASVAHPAFDFFGNPRPDNGAASPFDIGAIEIPGNPTILPAIVAPPGLIIGSPITGAPAIKPPVP